MYTLNWNSKLHIHMSLALKHSTYYKQHGNIHFANIYQKFVFLYYDCNF